MKLKTLSLPLLLALAAGPVSAQTNFAVLTREHADMRILYTPGASQHLALVARDEDRGINHASNEVILVCREQARLTLPAGTPFGDAGQPFWILPQSQNVNLLYLGVSAEGIPAGVFNGPLTVRLTALQGPGYFMVWQATGPGQYNIRINTRDGVSAADAFTPITGSHEHFNWGFSSTGVFCATFQITGQRVGEATNIVSPHCTFAFHVLPLPPPTNFPTWQKHFWPPGFNPPTTLTNGNPDGDPFDNLGEYGFALSPTNANPLTAAPFFSFVTNAAQRHGALTFTRYKPALDLNYTVEATDALPGGWMPQTNVFSTTPGPTNVAERVTIRDALPATNAQRFYRLRVNLR